MSTMPVKTFFPEFVPNQILTNIQLNDLREYLDNQNRLTRVRLIGTGIVCGLHATLDDSGANPVVKITEGFGLTSDGYLLEIAATDFVAKATYLDPDRKKYILKNNPANEDEIGLEVYGPEYAPWRLDKDEIQIGVPSGLPNDPPGNPTTQIAIIELLPSAVAADNNQSSNLQLADFQDHVLVLYLEIQKIDLKSCLTTDCNNKGQNLNFVVKALLIHKDELTPVEPCENWTNPVFIPRFHRGLRQNGIPHLENISTAAHIDEAYSKIIHEVKNPLFQKINNQYASINPFLQLNIDFVPIQTAWNTALPDGSIFNQYHYDFIQEVAGAYNEFLAHYCKIIPECCPTLDFPRHLMIRDFEAAPEPYRHEFKASPVRNVMHHDLQKAERLFLRIVDLITHFDLSLAGDIKITPSQNGRYPLGEKAIPHYYDILIKNRWQAEACCRDPRLLSYAENTMGVAGDNDFNLNEYLSAPLETTIDKHSFFRIEGHLGKDCEEVIEELEMLRQDFNLDFDIKLLHLNNAGPGQPLDEPEIIEIKQRLEEIDDLRREIQQLLVDGQANSEEITQARHELNQQWQAIRELNAEWGRLRSNDDQHCDLTQLRLDYLMLRSRVLCTYSKIKKMLLNLPDLTPPQSACVTFDTLDINTRFGSNINNSGDEIFEENGISVSIHDFFFSSGGTTFNFAEVIEAAPTFGSNHILSINNVNLRFNFSALPFTPTSVTFDFRDFGGIENMVVNEEAIAVGNLQNFPANIATGVTLSVTSTSEERSKGTATLTGNIKSLLIGGQEFSIDNVCARVGNSLSTSTSLKTTAEKRQKAAARAADLKANLSDANLSAERANALKIELAQVNNEREKLERLENTLATGIHVASKIKMRTLTNSNNRAAFTPLRNDDFGELVLQGLLFGLINLKEEVDLLCAQLPKEVKKFNYCLFIYHYKNVISSIIQIKLLASVLLDTFILVLGNAQPFFRILQINLLQFLGGRLSEITDYLNCFNRLQYNCFQAEFATIYYTLDYLLQEERTLFSNFARSHQGMEHLAGVERGNTFLLVCENDKVVADFTHHGAVGCCCDFDPEALCLPPVALPDYKIIKIALRDGEATSEVETLIDVLSNDYNLNSGEAIKIVLPTNKSFLNEQNQQDNLSIETDAEGKPWIRYTHDVKLGMLDSFKYQLVNSDCNLSDESEVLILIRPESEPMIIAQEDIAATSINQPIDIDVALNDYSAGFIFDDVYTLSISNSNTTFNGVVTVKTVTLNGLSRQVFGYRPPIDFVGRDTFFYKITDENRTATGQVTVLIVPCCEGSDGQNPPDVIVTGRRVIGRVIDSSGEAIIGSIIRVLGTSMGAITDIQGDFTLTNLPLGNQVLEVSVAGFRTKMVDILVQPTGGNTRIEIVLVPQINFDPIFGTDLTTFVAATFTGKDLTAIDPNKIVIDTFSNRHTERLGLLNDIRNHEVVRSTAAFRKADTFLTATMIDADTSPEKLAAVYEEVTAELIDAHKLSSGETKEKYKDLIETTTHAYMDKMIIKNPNKAEVTMKAALELATEKIKKEGISLVGFKQRFGGAQLKKDLHVSTIKDLNKILK